MTIFFVYVLHLPTVISVYTLFEGTIATFFNQVLIRIEVLSNERIECRLLVQETSSS